VVSIIACTNDWFGGWDAVIEGDVNQMVTPDLKSGRMQDVIRRGEPAVMYCHWPGIYFNGTESGFNIIKEVTRRLHASHGNLIWMKLSELARYWAAKELTGISAAATGLAFRAPYACPDFTVKISKWTAAGPPTLRAGQQQLRLREVSSPLQLQGPTWTRQGSDVLACFDLPKGDSQLAG